MAEDLAIADALLQTAQGSVEKQIAYSKAIQAYENALVGLRISLNATAAEKRALERRIHADGAGQKRLLSGLMRLSRASTPALALGDEPRDLLQSAILLERVNSSAREKVNALKTDIVELENIQAIQSEINQSFSAALASLKSGRAALSDDAEVPNLDVPDAGEDAANLAALAIALDGLPGPVPPSAPEARYVAPVRGELETDFNSEIAQGVKRPGVVIAASPGGIVTAPVASSVRFAGTLDGYGRVVILEPSAGQLLIFAGLEQLVVRAGSQVDAGQGVGFLAGEPVLHEDFLDNSAEESGETPFESLYIEVRVDGTPVDPGLWFAFDS